MDFFHFATTNARYEFQPRQQAALTDAKRLEQQHRDQLVTKYLTKPIVVTPVGGGEDK